MQRHKSSFFRRCLLSALLLTALCLFGSFTAQAYSFDQVKTVSGGRFVKKGSQWMYRYKNGSYAKNCLLTIKGKTYCFSKKGYRQSGWKWIQGKRYYFGKKSEGFLYKKRWLTSGGKRYYLKKNGQAAVGWAKIGKKTYYFDSNGVRLSGWQIIDGKKYYLGTANEGWRYEGRWLTYNNRIFYLKKDGSATVGWATIGGKRYYFSKEGRAYRGKHVVDGQFYCFSDQGVKLYSGADIVVTSKCAILIDADTGDVLYAKNADKRHANASTTKIMTCILALENAKLTDKVKVSAYAASQEPTKLYMRAGDSFRMKDLLYSLMIPSHNDTAVAIAEHISGSTKKFAELMNKKAKELGCNFTHFVTPNGLDNGVNHYTSARDLSTMARYALKNSTFRKIIRTPSYSFKSLGGTSYTVTTTNQLLGTMDGVIGMKTGFTNKAGYCFVGVIKNKKGKTYISVTLGAPTGTARWDDARKLLGYAYRQ